MPAAGSEAVASRRPLSVGLVGNAADAVPRLLSDAHTTILDAPSRRHLAYRPGVPLIWRTLGAGYRLPPAGDQT